MEQRRKKWMVGAGIAAGSAAVMAGLSYGMTKFMLKIAMDREMPKEMTKVRSVVTSVKKAEAFVGAVADAAKRLEDGGCEEVSITSGDGLRLVGHWRPCENAKRVIVAMHGWRSSWTQDFGLIADFWYQNGCSVLYAEQRGQNNSGGDYMGFGMTERYDCLDWINWVNARCEGKLPVYLAGVSMGAATVLMAAGLELPENVRGILADCGFTSPHAIWKHVVENNLHMSYGIRGAIANDICKKKINMSAKEYSATDAMQSSRIPVLFVHGTDDQLVPVEMTYENYKACTAPKRLLIVPGADHAMSYYLEKEKYEKQVLDFWEEFQ